MTIIFQLNGLCGWNRPFAEDIDTNVGNVKRDRGGDCDRVWSGRSGCRE
ncbi:hypothetical protein H6F89_00275 [Cyanobacteria bacterium FACHB-63]|nr:hypothetical protein [Cyanobacteria bacterium FACHB-63]